MRQIGNLADEVQARLFHDYLYARGIRNEIEQDGHSAWLVWVADEEQLEEAKALLERFRQNPGAPEFAREAAASSRLREQEARDLAEYRKRFFTRRQVFPGARSVGVGLVTYALIVACILLAVFSRGGRDQEFLRPFFIVDPYVGDPGLLRDLRTGEVWRFFTPALIHFGLAHLLFNMMWLFELGSLIESRQGHIYLVLMVLALAAGSNAAEFALAQNWDFGGMSGVIYGLFGYVWIRGKLDPSSGLFIDRRNVILMLVWLVLCTTGLVGRIANVAHASGLAMGAAYGLFSAFIARSRRS